jgi:hypothetical protein
MFNLRNIDFFAQYCQLLVANSLIAITKAACSSKLLYKYTTHGSLVFDNASPIDMKACTAGMTDSLLK